VAPGISARHDGEPALLIRQTEDHVFLGEGLDDKYAEAIENLLRVETLKKWFFIVIHTNNIGSSEQCKPVLALLVKKFYQDSTRPVRILIENIYEAPSYQHDLKIFMDSLSQQIKIPVSDMVMFTGALHNEPDPVLTATCMSVSTHKNILQNYSYQMIPSHHFISLARLAKNHRILATVAILDRGLDKYGHCSLGSGSYFSPEENDFSSVPERYQNLMPMYLDGDISDHGKENLSQYDNMDARIHRAFANLVLETSYDRSVNADRWNLPIITEKSIKPFAWGQIPLFVSSRYTVSHIRKLGFDMFDDLIDHSYDSEPDPHTRIQLVIDQLQRLCMQDMDHWQQFKAQNMHRYEKNRNLVYYLDNNKNILTRNNLLSCLSADNYLYDRSCQAYL
jgi:hypothetical protein